MGTVPQTFKRKEIKYLITKKQRQVFLTTISSHLEQDKFGHSTISNIYYDDPNARLIRNSIEKPQYKEKLRLRGYNTINSNSTVFIELKKKYKGIVYKRRLSMSLFEAYKFLNQETKATKQIEKEVLYFLDFYKNLTPAMFLSYERDAYYCKEDSTLRITFDSDIRYRTDNINLSNPKQGSSLIDTNTYVMEIKCADAMPLWLVDALSNNNIYQTSFSKYGTAYLNELKQTLKGIKKIA